MNTKKCIDVSRVRVGMYVCGLDRNWLDTPYWRHAFRIENAEQIERLRGLCRYVFIDTNKGDDVEEEPSRADPASAAASEGRDSGRRRSLGGAPRKDYRVSLEKELKTAQSLYNETHSVIENLLNDVRLGRSLDSRSAQSKVESMVGSVVRNPNALLCLTRLKDRDRYTSMHSVNVCIFALAFGRHIGLTADDLFELGMGALLHDLGKMWVPLEILKKPGPLTPEEFEVMKAHPGHGRELLAECDDIPKRALAVAAHHHERYDGTGYPDGLKGREIQLFPRIVAVCDVYDAITSKRSYNVPISEHAALRKLYEGRGTAFEPRAVDKFIQCIGVYPVGSVVALTNGEIGVVVTVNEEDRTRPTVKLLLGRKGHPYNAPRYINLLTRNRDSAGRPLAVNRVLDPAEYDLDLDTLTVRTEPGGRIRERHTNSSNAGKGRTNDETDTSGRDTGWKASAVGRL
ncbi:MAG TPA: HD-GYP domain-containing protein [Gammaproteobacteria bacterium]|nr:HD-GYP domain-containing protein [Gammaproteobacteria bacterium]